MSYPAQFDGALRDKALRELVAGGPVDARVSAHQAARLGYFCLAMGGEAGPERYSAPEFGDPPALLLELARNIMSLHGIVEPAQINATLSQMRGRAWSAILAATPRPLTRAGVPSVDQVVATEVEPAHLGFFRFDKLQIQSPKFDGKPGPKLSREVHVGVDAALVLPYDPQRDVLVLVEQFRVGLWRRGDPQPWSLEPVAGLVDPGETPEDTARREAVEEVGLDLTDLQRVSGGYASPGYSTDFFHMFIAFCDLPETGIDGRIGGADHESEHIRAHEVSFARAMEMFESGELSVAPLQLMLLWLARWRAERGM